MTLHATVQPGPNEARILVTDDGDDCLKAVLPMPPRHHRALHTLLEGVALWHSRPLRAVLIADDRWGPSHVEDLFGGGLWPYDLANVRFEVHHPRKARRIRGPADFRGVYALHGVVR